MTLNIDKQRVWEDDDTTFADLPDPSTLDDEAVDLWQLATLAMRGAPVVYDDDEANGRYYAWEDAINAEWERRFPDGRSPTVVAGEAA